MRRIARWPRVQSMRRQALVLQVCALASVCAQQIDPFSDPIESMTFTAKFEGKERTLGVSLDSNYRWLYNKAGTCTSSTPAKQEKCNLQGIDKQSYAGTYGVSMGETSFSEVILKYASLGRYAEQPNYGTRVFVTDMDDPDEHGGYTNFKLLGKEFSFTIDLSQVPAGMNAAVYLVSMDPSGNLGARYSDGQSNGAGWKRGVGYCDAQCPKDMKFVQGTGWHTGGTVMSCCPEMDLFEGNRMALAMTAHPCRTTGPTTCDTVADASCENPCDTDGADSNLFRRFGPDRAPFKLADMTKPLTVRTKFHINDEGTLHNIVQTYEQAGFNGEMDEVFQLNISDEGVDAQKALFGEVNKFAEVGGLAQMGAAMEKGMVLALAIWADESGNMNWLDSCTANETETNYSCADNLYFSSDAVFWSAWKAKKGIWRGPADYYANFSSSFATTDVTFVYPDIPPWMKTQLAFECPRAGVNLSSYDCKAVPYKFTVRDMSVTDLGEGPKAFQMPWNALFIVGVIVAVLGLGGFMASKRFFVRVPARKKAGGRAGGRGKRLRRDETSSSSDSENNE